MAFWIRRIAAYVIALVTLGLWVAVAVLAVLDGFTFLADTSFDVVAPKGSATLAGEQAIGASFFMINEVFELDSAIVFVATRIDGQPCAAASSSSSSSVAVSAKDPAFVDSPALEQFLTDLAVWLRANNDCRGGNGPSPTSSTSNATQSCYFRRLSTSQLPSGGVSVDSYVRKDGDRSGPPANAGDFDATLAALEASSWRAFPSVKPRRWFTPKPRHSAACATSWAIERDVGYGNSKHAYPAWDRLYPYVQAHAPVGWKIQLAGTRAGLRAARDGAIRDMAAGEPFTLPLAFLVLALAIGPLSLLVLVTLPAAGLGSMLVLSDWHVLHGFLGLRVQDSLVRRFAFASFTPPIIICLLVALSVDYALFILSRFYEETLKGRDSLAATGAAVLSAGRAVLVSGLILAAAMCAISLTEIVEVKTIGIGGAVTIAVALACNLTLLPALLVLTGGWGLQPLTRCYDRLWWRGRSALERRCGDQQKRCCCCTAAAGAGLEAVGFLEANDSEGDGGEQTLGSTATAMTKKCDWLCLASADDIILAALWAKVQKVYGKAQEDAAIELPANDLSVPLVTSDAYGDNGGGSTSAVDAARSAAALPSFVAKTYNVWRHLGLLSLHHRYKVLILSALGFLPFVLLAAFSTNASASTYMIIPRNSDTGKGLNALLDFGTTAAGTLAPLTLMISATDASAAPLVAPASNTTNKYAIPPFCEDAMDPLRRAIRTVHGIPADIRKLLLSAHDCVPIELALPALCNASAGPSVVDGVDIRPLARFCAKTCGCPMGTWLLSDSLYKEAVEAIRYLISLDEQFGEAVLRNPRAVRSIFSRPGSPGDDYVVVTSGAGASSLSPSGRWLSAQGASELARAVDPLDEGQHAMLNSSLRLERDRAVAFQELWNLTVSPVSEPPAALIILTPPWSTQGQRVCGMMDEFRHHITPANGFANTYAFIGGVMEICEQKKQVMSKIVPLLTLATIGVVFVLCVVAFRSILLPLRLVATIALTIGSVFGAANLIFRYVFGMDGLYWLVYPICTPILIGIVIDYDVLLVSRIFEYRARHGFETRAAVLRGLRRTGSTITLAGVIMMLAFGALLFAQSAVLNQFGFLLVVASGIDTFVVRTIVVPALMLVAADTNWWPGACVLRATNPQRARDDDVADGYSDAEEEGEDEDEEESEGVYPTERGVPHLGGTYGAERFPAKVSPLGKCVRTAWRKVRAKAAAPSRRDETTSPEVG